MYTCETLATPGISVIIPVLNEQNTIRATLEQLVTIPDLEVIVVDGGSQDGTKEWLAQQGVKMLTTKPGRAYQMNQGAAIAKGESLVFLHADTQLPENFSSWVQSTLAQPGIVAGAFLLKIDGQLKGLRLVEWLANWRSCHLQMPYGDQAIFIKATTFQQVGQFAEMPIMEDFELIQRLRCWGKIAIVPMPVITSARRWQKLGVLKTTLINQGIVLAYRLGVPPDRLVQWYRSPSRNQ